MIFALGPPTSRKIQIHKQKDFINLAAAVYSYISDEDVKEHIFRVSDRFGHAMLAILWNIIYGDIH